MSKIYIVKSGDTLWGISKKHHISVKEGEFKHEVRQFEKSYDNQQAEQISLMV
nr:LysM peptidoglycan-binding domain-containing protein [Acinetobacter baumannii]